jgi:type I restriction enzyme S subunit
LVPPDEAQVQIVRQPGERFAGLGALRSANGKTIRLLNERRAALIAAAVTGKLPIPGLPEWVSSKQEMACSSTT